MARDMDRWLGDGGMRLLGDLGVELTGYAVSEDGAPPLARVDGVWKPAALACNPNGAVQGGVYGVVVDAVMTFATLAALERGETCSLLEMKMSYLRPAASGDGLAVRGEVLRLTRSVAFCRAAVLGHDGLACVEATGTNLLRRAR